MNESRHHTGRRGCKVQNIIQAFVPGRDPKRRRVNATENRRLFVAEVLDMDWDIETEGLLEERTWVRLVSRWRLPLEEIARELQPARSQAELGLVPQALEIVMGPYGFPDWMLPQFRSGMVCSGCGRSDQTFRVAPPIVSIDGVYI